MTRVTLLFALMFASGCGPSGNGYTEVPPATETTVESPQRINAFEFDEAAGVISLDTRVQPQQRRRFDIGQGAVTIETIDIKDGNLTFHYTPEVEGGYTIYACTVPVSKSPVTIKVNRDGTPGETSFDLTECRIVKSGNVHWE